MNRSPIERSISYLLLALILIFSITSTGNVAEFVHRYHKGWTGITLGLAFGVTTFLAAYITTASNRKQTRATAIIIGTVFGLASAAFQRRIYLDGAADELTATLLAFLPIMFGEIGLAVLEHMYAHDAPQLAAQPDIAQLTVQPDDATQPVQPDIALRTTQPDIAQLTVQPNDATQPVQPDIALRTTQPDIAQLTVQPNDATPANDSLKRIYLQRRQQGEPHMDLCRELDLIPSTASSWWRRMQLVTAQMQPSAQGAD